MTLLLTGIGDSPIPRIAREFKFGQGQSTGAGNNRPVVLVGNKTSAGTESAATLGLPIESPEDMDLRFGARSELRWMYYAYRLIDPTGPVSAIAVAEGGGAAAATVTFTFATTATDVTNMIIEWGGFQFIVPVATGDTAIVQCAAATAKINADPNLPFTAAQGAPANDHIMTVTAAQLGPRGDHVLRAVRVRYQKSVGTTATKGAVSSGTGADDVTAVTTELAGSTFFYHVLAATAAAGITSTDNGVGEYITFVKTQALPVNGKDQTVIIGLDCTQSQATSVATSSAANSVYAFFYRVENNDWFPGMIAAHHAAMKRSQEVNYAAYNFAGYTNTDTTPYFVPPPYAKADVPTTSEQTADLNNGVSAVSFRPDGTPYLVRDVTSRSWTGSSATKDYRAREGHITSVTFEFWEEVYRRYVAQKQPNVMADPPQGRRPLAGFDTPQKMRDLIGKVMTDMAGTGFTGGTILDPSVLDEMIASISVEINAAGFGTRATVQPVRHNLFDDFLIQQAGPAY